MPMMQAHSGSNVVVAAQTYLHGLPAAPQLSDALRHIIVALSDRWLLGLSFMGTFYDLFAKALNWILPR